MDAERIGVTLTDQNFQAIVLESEQPVLGRVCKVYSTPNHRMVAAISHMAW
jgi:hypothetical protein